MEDKSKFACKGTKNFWDVQIHLQFFRKGSPKSYARMGRAEALVARWLSGAVSAIATQVPNAKYRCSLAELKVRRIFGDYYTIVVSINYRYL